PGGAPAAVAADACHCSGGRSDVYDVEVCRADVTGLIGAMDGSYTVDGTAFAPIPSNVTANASFAIVLVYQASSLPPRRIALSDGAYEVISTLGHTSLNVVSSGFDGATAPAGKLVYYMLHGTISAAPCPPTPTEYVSVQGLKLTDADNRVCDPINWTIN